MKSIEKSLIICATTISFCGISVASEVIARVAYEKAIMDFYVGAYIQSKIVIKLEEKCPQKEKSSDFINSIRSDIEKNIPSLVKFTEFISDGSILYETYANELVKNVSGCETASFKEVHEMAKEQYSMFFLRWVQKKFD